MLGKVNYKYLSVVMIMNKYFWKTKTGPIFSIAMPLVFMIIYIALGSEESPLDYFISGLPAYLAMTIIPLSLMTLPAMTIEFRNSILLRKIKTNNIGSLQYNMICLLYYFLISLAFAFSVMILFIIIVAAKNASQLSAINWGSLIYGMLMLILSSIAFGLFLSSFLKNIMSAQLISTGLYFLTLVLGGQFIPIQVISQMDAIKYISLFSPLNYATSLLNISSLAPAIGFTNNIFDLSQGFDMLSSGFGGNTSNIHLYDQWQKILFIIMPFVLTATLTGIGIKFFTWSGR